ncbi:hypothetical protein HanRHA438_Chr17g0837231 [Helianthus annuus]|nr:hypothetical protein HanHA300_Chr17g0673361 [Helianthus annuus]KAJ0449268.1 hypothetical protein HanHA89_Chr17g0726511 [Helianthus annuus]KAJ0828440.1 hypothetical protein HanRHA438_Chr17g0837231 [Helianthus annuus]
MQTYTCVIKLRANPKSPSPRCRGVVVLPLAPSHRSFCSRRTSWNAQEYRRSLRVCDILYSDQP